MPTGRRVLINTSRDLYHVDLDATCEGHKIAEGNRR